MRCFGASVGGASARKPPELAGIWRNREISDGKSMPESIALLPAMPRIGLAAVVFGVRRAASGIFEDQDAAIAERDFFGLPDGALVERVVL